MKMDANMKKIGEIVRNAKNATLRIKLNLPLSFYLKTINNTTNYQWFTQHTLSHWPYFENTTEANDLRTVHKFRSITHIPSA